jgi:hypothetical protein
MVAVFAAVGKRPCRPRFWDLEPIMQTFVRSRSAKVADNRSLNVTRASCWLYHMKLISTVYVDGQVTCVVMQTIVCWDDEKTSRRHRTSTSTCSMTVEQYLDLDCRGTFETSYVCCATTVNSHLSDYRGCHIQELCSSAGKAVPADSCIENAKARD